MNQETYCLLENFMLCCMEAKILFDADKLDVAGAIGIARTLLYKGIVSEPLYSVLPDGIVSTGENDTAPSFFQEYKYKLENLYSLFYTERAAVIARERQHISVEFYNSLYQEVNSSYQNGIIELHHLVKRNSVTDHLGIIVLKFLCIFSSIFCTIYPPDNSISSFCVIDSPEKSMKDLMIALSLDSLLPLLLSSFAAYLYFILSYQPM